MNETARERLKNPPPKPVAGWIFAVAAIFGVAARIIYVAGGPRPLGLTFIVVAVALAAASLVLKVCRGRKPRAGKGRG